MLWSETKTLVFLTRPKATQIFACLQTETTSLDAKTISNVNNTTYSSVYVTIIDMFMNFSYSPAIH